MSKENKTKPKYGLFNNMGFMISNANKVSKSIMICTIVISILTVALNLTELYVAPYILAKVENKVPIPELIITIAVFAGVLFILTVLKGYLEEGCLYGRISARSAIIARINDKSNTTSYINTLKTSFKELKSKANDATMSNQKATEHIYTTMNSILTNIIGFVIYLMLLSNINLFLIAIVIVTSVMSFLVSRKTDEWRYNHREEESVLFKKMWYISGQAYDIKFAKDVRLFGLSSWIKDIYAGLVKSYAIFIGKSESYKMIGSIVDCLLSILRNAIAYVYLINMVIKGSIGVPEFLLYFTAVSGFTAWITGILQEFSTAYKESLDINSVREFLDYHEPFKFEGGTPIPENADGYEIKLENVSFKYDEAEDYTLKNLNLTIKPGEKLAVVGLNGAGKTTLIKLICGLFDPTEGTVLLNNIDIREFNRREYYKLFSTVFQTSEVMDVSVAENVAQAAECIDVERVKKSLELAGLTEKINELSAGIDTKLGHEVWDDGVELSGGQNQRLLLARALYKDAPLLVLDEPTAALDPIAENDIYLKYNEMTKGKSSAFVSHRLASTRFCDRIIFIADGGIKEEGTHDELMKLNGAYAELFEVQSRYYREGRDF